MLPVEMLTESDRVNVSDLVMVSEHFSSDFGQLTLLSGRISGRPRPLRTSLPVMLSSEGW